MKKIFLVVLAVFFMTSCGAVRQQIADVMKQPEIQRVAPPPLPAAPPVTVQPCPKTWWR